MVQAAAVPFLTQFAALRDPRQAAKVLYPLPELLLLLLCGTVAGAEDFVELTLWGEEHLAFLRRFLPFARGIPSHDTLCEVIAAIDPELFKTCFTNWVERLRMAGPETIAIDGKTSRRSHARSRGRGPLHTVSAWATRQQLVLGQEAVSEKSNEIIAIPLLLQRLELAGAIVTIDAMLSCGLRPFQASLQYLVCNCLKKLKNSGPAQNNSSWAGGVSGGFRRFPAKISIRANCPSVTIIKRTSPSGGTRIPIRLIWASAFSRFAQ